MDKNSLRKLEKFKSKINPKVIGMGFALILALSILVYVGIVIYRSGFFKVYYIKSNVSVESFIKDYIKGKSLLSLDMRKIYVTLSRIHPEYKEIAIIKEFPSTLNIKVTLRKPFVLLYLNNKFYLMDKEGVVINASEINNFPQMMIVEIGNAKQSLPRGTRIKDSRLFLAYKLKDVLSSRKFLEKFQLKAINSSFPDACYFTVNDTHIVIGSDDFERKLYILENLFNEKLKGDLSSIDYIDLRHKKAYLGYK